MLRSIRRLPAVQGHEDVLEVGLVHVERPHVEAGECLDERVDLALEREAHDVTVPLDARALPGPR